ncbi:MAG: ribonuclease PH, partial [Deltaproteobacteria bacterium]|nr:ribonuclease PH [Deltaproteobacteria bacterium]
MRHDGRADDALRNVEMTPDFLDNPLGSVMIHMGQTRILCNASVEERVPPFLNGSGEGWITGEYAMIPAA